MLISAENLHKNYGTKQLLSGVSLYLERGDKVGIIGVNGTGKSTLLKLLTGKEPPDEGHISRDPGVTTAYLPQNPVFTGEPEILGHVLSTLPEEQRISREHEAKAMLIQGSALKNTVNGLKISPAASESVWHLWKPFYRTRTF